MGWVIRLQISLKLYQITSRGNSIKKLTLIASLKGSFQIDLPRSVARIVKKRYKKIPESSFRPFIWPCFGHLFVPIEPRKASGS